MVSRRHVASSFVALLLSWRPSQALLGLAVAGCGGSGPGLFGSTGPDGGSGNESDASLLGDSTSLLADANLPPCPPAPVTSFTPAWKPPRAAKTGACTTAQISSFFDACLSPSSTTPAGCAAYVQANGACAACLQSDDTDPQYGPVIWHSSRLYYTTNIAGCIADVQNDGGAAGCGAAYQAVVQCKETACSACISAQTPDFARYAACENQAGSECGSYIKTLTSTCGATLKDPTNPIAACSPPPHDTAQDAYLRLAPIFCGP